MSKALILKSTGAAILIGIVVSAIMYGSPLSLFWDLSALSMTALFVVPHIISKKNENFLSPLLAAITAGLIGLVLMLINIKDPSKLGMPMAFTLLTGLYVFSYQLVSNLFKNYVLNPSSPKGSKNAMIACCVLGFATAFILNHQLGSSQILDLITAGYFTALVLVSVLFRENYKNIPEIIFESSVLSGVIIFIISIVQILQNLSNKESLIPVLGISFLGPLYAFILATISVVFFKPEAHHRRLVLLSFVCTSIYTIQFLIIKYVI